MNARNLLTPMRDWLFLPIDGATPGFVFGAVSVILYRSIRRLSEYWIAFLKCTESLRGNIC